MANHRFVGRLDRWCEICDRPSDHPIHSVGASKNEALIAVARAANLRNRNVERNFFFNSNDTIELVNTARCNCGNILTIEDGARCRQCVLDERMA